MRQIKLLPIFVLVAILFSSCEEDNSDVTGSIYGIVTDADNGEPIRGASVTLNPGGLSASTGNDGRFEFLDLSPMQYIIQVVKSDYQTNSKAITIIDGKIASGDIQLSRGTSKMKLSTNSLDFGVSSNTLTFTVMNVSTSSTISWSVSNNNDWLSISPTEGSTDANKSSVVTVTLIGEKITKDLEGTIIVNTTGESHGITVKVGSDNNSGNGNGGGTVVAGGLAAYYTFNDETAVDVTGNGYDGALINSPEFIDDTPNGAGKAVFLRKVNNQKITIESPIKNTDIHTICLWLKDVGTGDIFYGANSNLKLNISNGVFNLHNECRYDGANILQDGKWHHVAVTGKYRGAFWDSWIIKLYVDGVLYGSDDNAVVRTLTYNSSSIYIGGENTFKTDDIRFYDRELSTSEVKQIYNAKQ